MKLSPQAQKLFQTLLQTSKPQTNKQLAHKLNIVPNSVYRLTQDLINMNLIIKHQTHPLTFSAKPTSETLGIFLLNQTSWFQDRFPSSSANVNFSFIQGRDKLMEHSVAEIDKCKKSVDLLRSGHEIPAETMRALVQAKNRGIITRMLIQDYSPQNAHLVSNWQQNGILVKYTQTTHLRLMLYDSRILYFMSYKHQNSKQDLGLKITYPPFATMLSQVFEKLWQQAEKI